MTSMTINGSFLRPTGIFHDVVGKLTIAWAIL